MSFWVWEDARTHTLAITESEEFQEGRRKEHQLAFNFSSILQSYSWTNPQQVSTQQLLWTSSVSWTNSQRQEEPSYQQSISLHHKSSVNSTKWFFWWMVMLSIMEEPVSQLTTFPKLDCQCQLTQIPPTFTWKWWTRKE